MENFTVGIRHLVCFIIIISSGIIKKKRLLELLILHLDSQKDNG